MSEMKSERFEFRCEPALRKLISKVARSKSLDDAAWVRMVVVEAARKEERGK